MKFDAIRVGRSPSCNTRTGVTIEAYLRPQHSWHGGDAEATVDPVVRPNLLSIILAITNRGRWWQSRRSF